MNREILFRGKRVDNGEWIQGCLLIDDMFADKSKWRYEIVFRNERMAKDKAEVIPSTVGQYTGLTDKMDIEIFEGDILEVDVRDKEKIAKMEYDSFLDPTKKAVWSVEYKERYAGGNGYYFYGKDRRFSKQATQSTIGNCHAIIIGNIHDNPELLEVSE